MIAAEKDLLYMFISRVIQIAYREATRCKWLLCEEVYKDQCLFWTFYPGKMVQPSEEVWWFEKEQHKRNDVKCYKIILSAVIIYTIAFRVQIISCSICLWAYFCYIYIVSGSVQRSMDLKTVSNSVWECHTMGI